MIVEKDPHSLTATVLDWRDQLQDDAITQSRFESVGLVVDASSHQAQQATVWLSGGVAGECYSVTCRIHTVSGRQLERSLLVQVVEL